VYNRDYSLKQTFEILTVWVTTKFELFEKVVGGWMFGWILKMNLKSKSFFARQIL